jgi:ABC-type branched-subunit amino acid transport system ATPase component
VLDVRDLRAGYGPLEILQGVALAVPPGRIVGVIGPNGAGKSTLLKTAFGLLELRRGRVVFDGEDVTRRPPAALVRRGMSYVPQVDNVFPSLTVEENLEMGAVIRQDDFRGRLEQVIGLFPNLAGKRRQQVATLSGGERQMVAMGRALMLDPRLLLLDEPSAGLAPVMVDTVFDTIVAINRTGVAVVLVEQNARQALRLSHRAYVLVGGQKRLEGSGEALLDDAEVGRLYLGG